MDCPTCGKSFDSEHGMGIHYGHNHEGTLPNRTCNGCEVEFYDPNSRLNYCDDCDPNAGENNGNWKGAKEVGTCQLCRTEFLYYPSEKKGTYCSECVESADSLLPENPAAKDRVVAVCSYCETTIEVCPSRIETRKRGIFCDLDCYGA